MWKYIDDKTQAMSLDDGRVLLKYNDYIKEIKNAKLEFVGNEDVTKHGIFGSFSGKRAVWKITSNKNSPGLRLANLHIVELIGQLFKLHGFDASDPEGLRFKTVMLRRYIVNEDYNEALLKLSMKGDYNNGN